MLTRDIFLELPRKNQINIARCMWENMPEDYRFNPLGGEANDLDMCDKLSGNQICWTDDDRMVIWDTGRQILLLCEAKHNHDQNYPLAINVCK